MLRALYYLMTLAVVLLLSARLITAQHDKPEDNSSAGERNPNFSSIEYYRSIYRDSRAALELAQDKGLMPEWREKVARSLYGVLGLANSRPVPLNPKVTFLGQRKGYRIERVVFSSERYADVPALMLIPDGVSAENPAPAVLCLHGNVPGAKEELAGETGLNPLAAEGLALYNDDYARDLAQRGFITFAIDLRDSGERKHWEPYVGPSGWDWREISGLMAIPLGRTYLGLCVFDAMRALDYLETRPEVRKDAIAAVGFSAGATLTAWLSVLDRRVKVAGISGTATPSRAASGPSAHRRQPSGMIPGIYLDLDWDLCVAAIVPTPLVMVYEYRDNVERAKVMTAKIGQAYERFGAADKLKLEYASGGHVWHGKIVVPFVETRLRALKTSQ